MFLLVMLMAAVPNAAATPSAALPIVDATATPEAAPVDDGWGFPKHLGPVKFDGEFGTFQLNWLAQFRLTTTAAFETTGVQTSSDVQVQRSRLMLTGTFIDGRVRVRSQLDLSPRALELIDAFADVHVTEWIGIRAGIAAIPFTLHFDKPLGSLPLVDWPLTTKWFGGGRQLGVSVFNPTPGVVNFALGVYSGQTFRSANGASFPRLYGGSPINHGSLQTFNPLGEPHPEVVGRIEVDTSLIHLSASGSWDFRPEYTVDESFRGALDGVLKLGPVEVWGAAYLSTALDRNGTMMISHVGTLAEAEWWIGDRLSLACRHSAMGRTADLRNDARAYADSVIRAAGPNAPQGLIEQYADVGRIQSEHETLIGLNFFLVGNDVRWSNDVAWLAILPLGRNDVRFRSQLQVGF